MSYGRNWAAQAATAPVGLYGQGGRASYPQNNYYHGYQLPVLVNGHHHSGGSYRAGDIPHGSQTFGKYPAWSRPDSSSSSQLAILGSRRGECTCVRVFGWKKSAKHANKTSDSASARNNAAQDARAASYAADGSTEWTASQDAILGSMRSGGESWSDIAKALRIDKRECRRRWKELAAIAVPEPDRAPALSSYKTWSPGSQYAQQKQHEEFVVANLARTYAPNGFDDLDLRSDRVFDVLDCQLLRLLKVKHEADKWKALQSEFANATGRMVDARLLQRQLEVPDGVTDRGDPSVSLSARDRRTLARCQEKREDQKWLAIQAGFSNAAERMVDIAILRRKLRDDDEC